MAFGGIIRFSEILKTTADHQQIQSGCLVDTSILFAGSYDLDVFNTPALELFDFMGELKIPLYTNVNIRAEFLDLHRRVTIPEGLCSLLSAEGKNLSPFLLSKLNSVYSSMNSAKNEGRTYKFNEDSVKQWRKHLQSYSAQGVDGWERFCTDFLRGKIETIWDETCAILGVNFLSLRNDDASEWLDGDLTWEDAAPIVGRFGIGSFDAMIINLFINSKFAALIKSDREIAYVVNHLRPNNKFVVIPDKLQL